ncbi:Type II secretion system protein D precursor [Novipirellula aureliae]|uniref:Type II secretion system protein D n=2 Tax=Novipirellula aureliae TaxID=2527966 RepID=A0A5C6EAH1_9BACT|nr:Type II secretion system protein D precursor [Novipirellula aureliae]
MPPTQPHFAQPSCLYALTLSFVVMTLGTAAAQPPPAAPHNQDVASTVSYAVRFKSASDIETVFAPLVTDSPQTQLRIDEERDRVILHGPPWAHELMEQILDRIDRPTSDQTTRGGPVRLPRPERPTSPLTPSQSATSTPPPKNQSIATARRLLPLPPGSAASVHHDVLQLLGERLQIERAESGELVIRTQKGTLRVGIDLARDDVMVDGPATVVEQFSRLISVLSQRYSGASTRSGQQVQHRVLMLPRNVQPKVQQMIPSVPGSNAGPNAEGAATGGHRAKMLFRLTGIAQAQTVQAQTVQAQTVQAQTAQANTASNGVTATEELPAPSNNPPQPTPTETVPSLPQLEGVEVETLPDLDAIILRGRDQDLDQLAEIIRELEQLSQKTQPAIEIVELQFTNSQKVADLIERTQESLIGNRQGRATVTPLGKPNALLLLGWGDAVTALKELIAKVDQPTNPETQFNLYRLRYATAAVLQNTIENFFANRDGELTPAIELTVDQRTNSLIVHAAPRDILEITRLVERLDTVKGEVVLRTRVFPIRNSLATDIADTLRETINAPDSSARSAAMELILDGYSEPLRIVSGILDNVQITVDARKNNLIISAPAENFEVIEALIRELDGPGMVAKIKIFPIQNGDAASLVETLRSLLPSQAGADPVSSAQLSSSPGESSLAPLRFTVDVRSNSIIGTGSAGDLKIVDALVTRLDEADAMQRQNTVYQLKNSPAVDVALAVNEFLRNTRRVENASPGSINPYAQLEKEVVVVPEPVSNKLIVSATPRYFDEVRRMIEKLDEQPPQVMIQALIAEVTLGDAAEFGVELGIQDSVLFDRSLLGDLLTVTSSTQNSTAGGVTTNTQDVVVAASNEPGFNFNNTNSLGNSASATALSNAAAVGGQGISNFAVGRGNDELGFGGLVLSASSQNVSVLLRALKETRRLEVLSRPQVLTLDNQPAFIQVGQRVPRITGSTISQVGQQNTIELENVGLILGVTPRISPEGNVTMEIDAEKSEVGPESEGIPVSVSTDGTVVRSPRVDVASAQATVSAADGETIILGGLISNNKKQVHRKVPWLGDLPLVKHLFRFDSVSNRRSELLIILTPHVIRSSADMDRLKQTEMARMSWCACDVFDLHGEIIADPHGGTLFSDSLDSCETEIIYPHIDPRGQSAIAPVLAAPNLDNPMNSSEVIEMPPPSFQVEPMNDPQSEPMGSGLTPIPQPNSIPTDSFPPSLQEGRL